MKIDPASDPNRVTTVIYQKVKPGRERGYEEWIKGILAAAKRFPGHLGLTVLHPQAGANSEYIIIFQFDTQENLQQWLDSGIRKEWVERSLPLIEKPQTIQVLSGFETWFVLPHQPHQSPPPRYKMTILTCINVFILVNFYNWLLAGVVSGLPPLLRSLIISICVVVSLSYIVTPQLTKILRRWLFN